MTKRPTNQTLAKQFRELLTKGVYFTDDEGEVHTAGDQYEAGMAATKPWRNELWRAFREIEDRLDPLGEVARKRDAMTRTLKGETSEQA